jgi:hypothetical protein
MANRYEDNQQNESSEPRATTAKARNGKADAGNAAKANRETAAGKKKAMVIRAPTDSLLRVSIEPSPMVAASRAEDSPDAARRAIGAQMSESKRKSTTSSRSTAKSMPLKSW